MQNALGRAPTSAGAGPARRSTTRGRRDVRQSTFQPVPDDMPLARMVEMHQNSAAANTLATSPSYSELTPAAAPAALTPQFTGMLASSPSRSMSLGSASSSGAAPVGFAQPHGRGLRASIVETVHVLLKAGEPTRVLVQGEIALAAKDVAAVADGSVRVRLGRYEQLEKSAPNTAFLAPVPNAPGEYALDVHALEAASASAATTTVLRYQVHVADGQLAAYSAIGVAPQWKCEPTQTSVLVSLNPTSASALGNASLDDVVLELPITSSGVSNVQTKPVGAYAADRKRITWSLGSVAAPTKVLARCAVAETSVVQAVALRWTLRDRQLSGLELDVQGLPLDELVRSVQGRVLAQP